MEASMGFAQVAVSAGIQAFFVLFLWRMARHLYPVIDAIKELDATRQATDARLAALREGEDGSSNTAL